MLEVAVPADELKVVAEEELEATLAVALVEVVLVVEEVMEVVTLAERNRRGGDVHIGYWGEL